MMHDYDAVLGRVNVELDGVRAPLEGPLKGGQCVLAKLAFCPAVPDALHAESRSVGRVYCVAVRGRVVCPRQARSPTNGP